MDLEVFPVPRNPGPLVDASSVTWAVASSLRDTRGLGRAYHLKKAVRGDRIHDVDARRHRLIAGHEDALAAGLNQESPLGDSAALYLSLRAGAGRTDRPPCWLPASLS